MFHTLKAQMKGHTSPTRPFTEGFVHFEGPIDSGSSPMSASWTLDRMDLSNFCIFSSDIFLINLDELVANDTLPAALHAWRWSSSPSWSLGHNPLLDQPLVDVCIILIAVWERDVTFPDTYMPAFRGGLPPFITCLQGPAPDYKPRMLKRRDCPQVSSLQTAANITCSCLNKPELGVLPGTSHTPLSSTG